MDEFLKNLNSPAWWIGVVVVGILINIFSAYLKRVLDKRLSKVSNAGFARNPMTVEVKPFLV